MATKDTSKIRVKDPQKYEYAYLLYMQRVPQKEIAERADVSQQTLSKWKEDGGWEMKRAARTISRDELLNKAMMRINDMLDDREGFNADAFSKAVSQLKELKGGYSLDDVVDVLMKFGDWLIETSANDKGITPEFIQRLTAYQDQYIKMRINNG